MLIAEPKVDKYALTEEFLDCVAKNLRLSLAALNRTIATKPT